MTPKYRLYIQQMLYDGETYTRLNMFDTYSKWLVVCSAFPFKLLPDAKDYVTRDWKDGDGEDVYVPSTVRNKSYDIDAEFIYVGGDADMRQNIERFIQFIYGKNSGLSQQGQWTHPESGRLCIYDEYTRTGRKDVVVKSVDVDAYLTEDTDPDAVATFKVKFTVYDPVTDVTPVRTGNTVTSLTF